MSTSVTGVTKHFPSAQNGFTTTLASTIASGATTVPLNSVAGYTNGQVAVMIVEPTSSTAKQTFTGTVDTAGVQLTSVVWTAGTNQTHNSGATVVDYESATHFSMIAKGLLVQHAQDGTHTDITSTSLTNVGALSQTGATTLAGSWDGWVGANESWSFASSTTITVPTDATTKYDVGDYIKITQSATVKYFVVTTVTATLLTVSGLNGVTVANSAITANAYSKTKNPHGAGAIDGAGLPYNPYKFYAYQVAAVNTGAGTFATIPFDTEVFDTSNNHAAGVFTAPISGFYQFNWNAEGTLSAGSSESFTTALHKNGAVVKRGSVLTHPGTASTTLQGSHGSGLLQMAASDTATVGALATTTRALGVASTDRTWWDGYLMSAL